MTVGEAVAAIRSGRIVGMPTDTVYGLAVDPFNEAAVGALYELKGRPSDKPLGLLVASAAEALTLIELPPWAVDLGSAHWPGALTLVAPPRVVFPDWVGHPRTRTVGVRVPDHDVARSFLEAAGPLAVTSANRSGGAECLSDEEARELFRDLVAGYLAGSCPGGAGSTVIDASGVRPIVLRLGPIQLDRTKNGDPVA